MTHGPRRCFALSARHGRIAGWLLLAAAVLALAAGLSLGAGPADALPALTQCGNNIDDDGDGKIDNLDPGCRNGNDNDETDPAAPAQCADGTDNDNDGKTDIADAGCAFAGNNSEAGDPVPARQCADGVDNDLDGKIDVAPTAPALPDPDCAWGADNVEATRVCSDGKDNDNDGKTDWPADFGCGGPNDATEIDPPQCNDGRDNDGDGRVDVGPDPGCTSAADTDETDPPPGTTPPPPPPGTTPARCADGKDNDGDARIDFPADPGCASAADDDEANAPIGGSAVPAICADGKDNDLDGRIDFPTDPGCTSTTDDEETDLGASTSILSPFPVVRLRGRIFRTSVRITLFTVLAPAASRVSIYCAGSSCPRKRHTVSAGRKTVRVRRFERRLRAGTVLRIYVTKPGLIGKYTRFQIRRGRVPLRVDRCARTPGSKPRRCPTS